MRLTLGLVSALLLPVPEALAQGAKTGAAPALSKKPANEITCRQLSAAIENGMKELSFNRVTASTTRTAPQATQAAVEQANVIATLNININLVIAAKCPLPRYPVYDLLYSSSAAACVMATGEENKRQRCDRSTWLPVGESVEPER